jgi:hypothetical protein
MPSSFVSRPGGTRTKDAHHLATPYSAVIPTISVKLNSFFRSGYADPIFVDCGSPTPTRQVLRRSDTDAVMELYAGGDL